MQSYIRTYNHILWPFHIGWTTTLQKISLWCIYFHIGILYLLVYRTDHYKRLKATVEKQSKKCVLFITPQCSWGRDTRVWLGTRLAISFCILSLLLYVSSLFVQWRRRKSS